MTGSHWCATLIQSAIDKTRATTLRAYEEPDELGSKVALKQPSCQTSLKNLWECFGLDHDVPSPIVQNFTLPQAKSFQFDELTPSERVSPPVPDSLLTGMYQEWKIVQHRWCRKWPKTTPDPM